MENNFLKQKYDLHKSSEVESASKRTEIRGGEKVPQDPSSRIENYLNRFREITDRKDPSERGQGMEALKHVLYDQYIIKPEEIPEGYYNLQKRIAREQGHGDIEITDEMKERMEETVIQDQTKSLDTWIDCLASEDASYPDWLKYFAFRSVLGMGEYDKEKKEFRKRSKGTTSIFPDINREALAYVLDAMEKRYRPEAPFSPNDPELGKLLESSNFAKLYAYSIEKVTPASKEQREVTKGKWIKYDEGSDATPLYESLQGHGTNWCTAGESTAKTQLEAGDFYVYYTEDQKGNASIPRIAIRMQSGQIAEVRGVADKDQNLEGNMTEIMKEKVATLPGGEQYKKKSADMKLLTEIERKTKAKESLTKDDLLFLYELNSSIEGFGYERDPRIKELRDQRKFEKDKDMLIVFECTKDEIAHVPSQISENTKAYVGQLEPGIFQRLPENLEHVYTSFPEGHIRKETIEIGGKNVKELEKEMEKAGIKVNDDAEEMMESKDFTTLKESEPATLIRLKVGDLGFPKGKTPTTDEIYKRIEELGLELCPPETGPQYRLQYTDQPMSDWVRIGMKQILDRDGRPRVFTLGRITGGLWLYNYWTKPADEWDPDHEFIFRLRKYES